jgi:RimJ/RimL family protein N-acetyltransferase
VKRFKNIYTHPQYLWRAAYLYDQWRRYLEDDYTPEYFVDLLERLSPYFWVIMDGKNVAGFVFLENVFPKHKAEINVCFAREYWGDYVRECAEAFFDYCFNYLGFRKLKALVYPQNYLVKTLLRETGFEKEGCFRAETIKHGKEQDIEIYSKIMKGK